MNVDVLKQGNKLIDFRNKLNKKHTLRRKTETPSYIEGFENKELWTKGEVYDEDIDELIKKDMDELKELETNFMKLLSEYTRNYELYMKDVINVMSSESSKYIGKNIKTNDGITSYVNNLGIARSYNDTSLKNRHSSCKSDIINVNEANISELDFRKGTPMRENEPCGYEGKNIFIGSESSGIVNLARRPGAVARQSTSYNNNMFPASNAIDGNMNTYNHTDAVKGTYLEVELEKTSLISNVVIHNIRVCCQNRFTKVKLDILNANGNVTYSKMIHRTENAQPIFRVNNIHKQGKIVRLTQQENKAINVSEVEVNGSEEESVETGKSGYVDESGLLRQYPEKYNMNENDPSCPTDKMSVNKELWNTFKLGMDMNSDVACNLGKVDPQLKTRVEDLNNELMNITSTINSKINNTKQKIIKIEKQNSIEGQYLNNQLSRFQELYKKYNNIDNKGLSSLDAMMEDVNTVETSYLYKYIMWGMIAVITLYFTTKHIRN